MYTDAEIIYKNVKKLEEGVYRVQGKRRTWEGLTDIQKLRFALIAAGEVLKTVKISDVVKAAGIKGMKTNEIIIAAGNAKKELPDYRLVIMREDPIENYSLLQNGVFTCCEFDDQ